MSGNNNGGEVVDFRSEILNEVEQNSYDSLKIWRMFQSKKSNLPNNQRIQNLSWRVNSISNARRQNSKVLKKVQMKNISLLKSTNHPTNEEFDYIEHIKKMTKEEFGDYNNIPLHPADFGDSANAISIYNGQDTSSNIDYSPDAANSLTSNTNSIFSNLRYDHSLSISSQVSNKPPRQQLAHPQIQLRGSNHSGTVANEFNIEHFLDLEKHEEGNPHKDSNFNEFDLLDLTQFDHNKDKKDNFSLSNYINSLETALKEDNKPTSSITPIFNNQTTINDTFTIPNNTNYNVTMNPKLQQLSKEQMSCNSCGTTTTPLWRKSTNEKNENLILCNACGLFLKLHGNLSKRNVNGNATVKKIGANPFVSDDHMGEVFDNNKFHSGSISTSPKRMPNGVVKEEDYDWLKIGL